MNLNIKRIRRRARTFLSYLRIFGPLGLFYMVFCLLSRVRKLVPVRSHWSTQPLFVRLNTSDVAVFRQVYLDHEYSIVDAIQGPLTTIIDGGANIGLTSAYFADRHPAATIYAIEPDASNFRLLEKNTAGFANVHPICGALWGKDGVVHISQADAETWAFRVEDSESSVGGDIPSFRLGTLLEKYGIAHLTLLKLDIEGAEYEVLEDSAHWIDKVGNIVIELHDRLRPGCSALFRKTISGFDIVANGRELTLASRKAVS